MIVTRADVGVAPYKRLGAFCRRRGRVPPRPGHCRSIPHFHFISTGGGGFFPGQVRSWPNLVRLWRLVWNPLKQGDLSGEHHLKSI